MNNDCQEMARAKGEVGDTGFPEEDTQILREVKIGLQSPSRSAELCDSPQHVVRHGRALSDSLNFGFYISHSISCILLLSSCCLPLTPFSSHPKLQVGA